MFKPSLTFKSVISLSTAAVFLFSSIAPAAGAYQQKADSKKDYWKSQYDVKAPTYNVSKPATMTETEKSRLIKDKAMMEKMGYDVKVDTTSRMVTVFDKGSSKPVMEFPFSDPDRLRKYSPKSVNQMLMAEMKKVSSANKAAFSHSLKNLPTESAVFFMAMGAVVATQLVSNYSQNPVAMKQHIDHSLSPMGIFGFYAFMYSQGVTSNVLGMYLKNPKFHHMIPYLGMSVGMFAQTYLSQIMMNPNVNACAKTMMGGKVTEADQQHGVDKDPCSAAYEQLALKKVLWESAPMLVSMLASSALAGAAQAVVTSTVLRVTGVDIAAYLMPGAMQLKGIRLLLVKGLQIGAFVQIDQWLNRSVTYAWKNIFDGDELDNISEDLEENVNVLKKNKWASDDKELQANMKLFKEKMSAWRMTNMTEVYEAYQNWQDSLVQLTGMYNTSYSFYGDFVAQVRAERFEDGYVKPLERKTPLYGIKANLEKDQMDFLLNEPAFIERQQYQTVVDVAQKSQELLKEENLKLLNATQKSNLKKIIAGLQVEDDDKLIKALVLLNSEIRSAAQNYSMHAYYKALWTVYTDLGAPRPILEKGRGWVTYYGEAPTSAETLKGTSFYRKVGIFPTPKITDFLVMQMICGPDVERGETAIKTSLGYPSVFMPPTIRGDKDQFDVCTSYKLGINEGVAGIYNYPVKTAAGQYEGFVSYLANQTRASVVGDQSKAAFDDWWKKNTETQMQTAFAQYSRSYEAVIIKMIRAIYRQGISAWNNGSVYNGTMNASFQEERVYLSLLNEILAPSQDAYAMNLKGIMGKAPTQPLLAEVESQFAILNGMIKKIKIVKVTENNVEIERIESPLENYQFEEQVKNIQAALGKVSAALGVGEEAPATQLKVTDAQRNMAVQALESLQALSTEMMMYGVMANAVSWDKMRNVKQMNAEAQQFQNEMQEKMAKIRSMSMPGVR
ncbi:hypothetical protein [Bdellovibrio sp. HCB209]|uniref:hypothetical protein n=1 Tax=Bdellovibrio sp. HCB209 TaxID=3394354 RepID=UPI0039B559CB